MRGPRSKFLCVITLVVSRCRHCEGCLAHGTGHFAHVLDRRLQSSFRFFPWVGGLPQLPPRMPQRVRNYRNSPTPNTTSQRQTSSESTSRGTSVFPHTSTLARPPSRSVSSIILVAFVTFMRFVSRDLEIPFRSNNTHRSVVGMPSVRRWTAWNSNAKKVSPSRARPLFATGKHHPPPLATSKSMLSTLSIPLVGHLFLDNTNSH